MSCPQMPMILWRRAHRRSDLLPSAERSIWVHNGIRIAQSLAPDARRAAQEFYEAVTQPNLALVLFFCSSEYDLDTLAAEISRLFLAVQVIGCTTAGEIGPSGYREQSLAGASFSADVCTVATGHIDELANFEISRGHAFCKNLLSELEGNIPPLNSGNTFAFLLVDGLSVREEPVARSFQDVLGKIPLVGGSAGDGLNFGRTYIYVDGSFHTDNASLTLINTPLPFKAFKTQHFVATDQRLVITKADPAQRVVKEINGLPAAEEYARMVGVDMKNIDPQCFAASPLVVRIDGSNYVRSIQKVNEDGSVTFFCAIEEGLVLRVARGVDLVDNLEQAFTEICKEIGSPQLVLSCDCILRKLEILQSNLIDRIADIFRRHNAVGFNTYGEQFRGVHVNQTLSGVAIGALPSEAPRA